MPEDHAGAQIQASEECTFWRSKADQRPLLHFSLICSKYKVTVRHYKQDDEPVEPIYDYSG